jgi:pyridoxamine 5'-phosphate oxidase
MEKDLSHLQDIRTEYIKSNLLEDNVDQNPIEQFSNWFTEAIHSQVMEPNAMTLATTSASGQANARTVLLKHADEKGFVFFTNYTSKKGHEIAENNKIALLFFWPELERQVRILGSAEKVSYQESEEYFHSRPVGSQLGALASHQSAKIESRATIEENLDRLTEKFKGVEIPLPDYWGGYRLIPHYFEFWQGGAQRLHDRIVYEKKDSSWDIYRVSP